jgi:hypothetical protein
MWQEAKKQEKFIRATMVDHKRRAERRKSYYDKIVPYSLRRTAKNVNLFTIIIHQKEKRSS